MEKRKKKFVKEIIFLISIHISFLIFGIVYALFCLEMDIGRNYIITYFQIEQREITPTIRIMYIIGYISIGITTFAFLLALSYINFKYSRPIIKENKEV